MLTETGIWQGRFQYIHTGHAHVFENDLVKFKDKVVAIVNPNPRNPAKDFERFGARQNPFSYFERMLLWKKHADSVGVQITIVPCWHARYIIALENDFLPPRTSRSWIIPISQDDREEDKSRDLKRQGENVYDADYMSEPVECRSISATMIRRCFQENNLEYRKYIPESICELTEKFAMGEDDNSYYAVPVINDVFDSYSLQTALSMTNRTENSYILFFVAVYVSEGEFVWKNEETLPWWFKNSKPGHKTYYKKSQVINKLMSGMNVKNYLIVPIFVMGDDFDTLREYNYTFLPKIENIKWIVNRKLDDMYINNFFVYLDNINAENNIIYVGAECELQADLQAFEKDYSTYIFVGQKRDSVSSQKRVFQKWLDRFFDSKKDELEQRILAGYDEEQEHAKEEALDILRYEIQMEVDSFFSRNFEIDEKMITDLKQKVMKRYFLI